MEHRFDYNVTHQIWYLILKSESPVVPIINIGTKTRLLQINFHFEALFGLKLLLSLLQNNYNHNAVVLSTACCHKSPATWAKQIQLRAVRCVFPELFKHQRGKHLYIESKLLFLFYSRNKKCMKFPPESSHFRSVLKFHIHLKHLTLWENCIPPCAPTDSAPRIMLNQGTHHLFPHFFVLSTEFKNSGLWSAVTFLKMLPLVTSLLWNVQTFYHSFP